VTIASGGTLLLDCTAQYDDGSVVDVTGVQIAQTGFTAAVTDAAGGQFSLSASSAVTASWPIGLLFCDLRLTLNGNVIYSDRFPIHVAATTTP
jgi:hypothetical protein